MKEELTTPIRHNSILVPLLVGGIVGTALGILFAPKSGSEIRKKIRDVSMDSKDKFTSTVGRGRELYDEAKVVVANAVEAGKQAYTQERERFHAAH